MLLGDDILSDISPADVAADLHLAQNVVNDIFAISQRKAWDKANEARCDFQRHIAMTRRASVNFFTVWRKSPHGKTLSEIKADKSFVTRFADEIALLIEMVLGSNLHKGGFAVVATPCRRHAVGNFGEAIGKAVAQRLRLPFYSRCATCRTRQRVNAVFDANNIPKEPNVIVVDDFITTGSTVKAMYIMLTQLGKNVTTFAGINNKL